MSLPPTEPRCRGRYYPCWRESTCLRNTSPLPPSGAVVADLSIDQTLWIGCPHYVDRVPAEPEKEKRRVHPPLGSA